MNSQNPFRIVRVITGKLRCIVACGALCVSLCANVAVAETNPSQYAAILDSDDPLVVGPAFFALVNLDDARLTAVKALVEKEAYSAALDAYRDFVLAGFKAGPKPAMKPDQRPVADGILKGDVVIGIQQKGPMTVNIGMPGKMNFYTEDKSVDPAYTRDWIVYANYMFWTGALLGAHEESKDIRYLQAWTAIWDDYAKNVRAQHDAFCAKLVRAETRHYSQIFAAFWCNARLGGMQSALAYCAHLPPETVRAFLPGVTTAHILAKIHSDINGLRRMPGAPNQQVGVASQLLICANLFNTFKESADWYETAKQAILAGTRIGGNLPDGSDLEQAFNYNLALAPTYEGIVKASGTPPAAWTEPLNRIARDRARFIFSLLRPTDQMPGLCTMDDRPASQWPWTADYARNHAADPFVSRIANHTWGDGKEPLPAFTSIAYPYGGFYVMRNGWDKQAHHLFFMASRPAVGHADRCKNSLQLTAFGKTMLIDSGPPTYSNAADVTPFNRYMDSTYAHNTLVVDGLSQVLDAKLPRESYDTPLPARWHSSSAFDLAEGLYTWSYEDTETENKKSPIPTGDVTHQRQVVFLKPLGLCLVVDIVKSAGAHDYTQVWNFAAAYKQEEVVADGARRCIFTQAATGPNITLRQFSVQPLRYASFYGQTQPVRGWYHERPTEPFTLKKVDVHANWSGEGDQLLVTLLEPMKASTPTIAAVKDLSNDNICGGIFTLADQRYGACQAALKPSEMSAGQISAKATLLVCVPAMDGVVHGLILGCEKLAVNGVTQSIARPDFEFTVDKGVFKMVSAVTLPAGFRWVDSANGAVPDYSKNN